MGGPRLTPDQLRMAAAAYASTENTSEAARAIDVNESTLRSAFDRERIARNREAHARACEKGLEEGLGYLMATARTCHGVLEGEIRAGEGLDAQGMAGLGRCVIQSIATVAALAKRTEERRQAKRTRKKTEADTAKVLAETAALTRENTPTVELVLAHLAGLSREDLTRLLEELRARRIATPPEAAPAKPEGT